MSSLFKGDGEESNRVQRVKTKLERWKVQAVDMVCGKYFHHPSSFQLLCLVSLSLCSLPSNSFPSSFLPSYCPSIHWSAHPYNCQHVALSFCPAVSILVRCETDHQCTSSFLLPSFLPSSPT